MRGEDGPIVGAFHYAKDISARQCAKAELASTQEALRQSQKIEAVGQLTGGVAHNINNLLTITLPWRPRLQGRHRSHRLAVPTAALPA
ncbi:hypothetical protein MEX01_23890 [Methylorubrum extorquens]|nr:hypothetical protein MEX01_23890 [Methylorubrum extorquens]